MKQCTKCGDSKPLAAFARQKEGKDGVRAACTPCASAQAGQWRARNREHYNATMRKWRARNPDRHLKYTQGASPEIKVALYAAQEGRCAACGTTEHGDPRSTVDSPRSWCLDHDHATGLPRGLLCNRCNRTLGHAQDSVERLLALVKYLQPQAAFAVRNQRIRFKEMNE